LYRHVIEPAVGINRLMAMVMLDAYTEDGDRVYLKFKPRLAPYKAAIFPLLPTSRRWLSAPARFMTISRKSSRWRGMIAATSASRYYAQDEIGTPFLYYCGF